MKDKHLNNPHDKFFKESFGRKEVAQSFIEEYLPETLRNQINFKTLEILKDSYIDKELTEHFSDILYKIKISGKNAYVYLLFEHKSYSDIWFGFQLLRNMIKIWESYLKQNKRVKKLPIIIPILIYHGLEKWNLKNSIMPLFEDITGTSQYIPDFKSEIFDISHLSDEKIKGEILLQVHFLLLKYVFKPELMNKVQEILELLFTLSSKSKATEYLEVMLRYLATSVDSQNVDELKTNINKVIKTGEEIMPTIAEKWVQEGIQKNKLEVAKKMLQKGLSNADIRDITGLSIKKIEEIRNSLKRK
jgi:predicted transposase/invertase (TIGR01784 family)